MPSNRRINIFHRSDGKCIHDKGWDEDGVHPSEDSDKEHISSETLWPLIQVFIQFAREVQGGSVKRLVFRNPAQYAPTVRRFQPAPKPKEDKKPVVVHVAHDELFVVAIAELLSVESGKLGLEGEKSEPGTSLTISEFCESVLEFLNKEQESFVATQSREDADPAVQPPRGLEKTTTEQQTTRGENVANFRGFAGIVLTSSSSNSTVASGSSGPQMVQSQSLEEGELSQATSSGNEIVKVNEAKLSEFVSKTQNLLRM